MSKQNRANPKYILIASPSQKLRQINSTSLHSKSHLTLPSQHHKNEGIRTKLGKDMILTNNKDVEKDLQVIQKDLGLCINNIVAQQKKNKIYKELIEVLQAQMKKLESEQKQMNKIQHEESLKKIQKAEYDIEQILQKYNEEVARINNLKEQVASARTDRVVFSNLFKKIEKQIKHNQQHYTSIIAKTQISREQLSLKLQAESNLMKEPSLDEFQLREQNRQLSNKATRRQNFIFLTNINSTSSLKKPLNQQSFQSPQSKSPSPTELSFLIEQTQNKMQKVLKAVGCQSCQQVQGLSYRIEGQNSQLVEMICEQDRKIEELQGQMQRIASQKQISQIYEYKHLRKLQSLSSNRKIRSIKHLNTLLTQSNEKQEQNLELLSNIYNVLNINCAQEEAFMMTQTLEQLQRKIEDVCTKPQPYKRTQSDVTLSNIFDHNLDVILNKMQKFQHCERIFNKEQLCSQYTKELSKNRRIKTKK